TDSRATDISTRSLHDALPILKETCPPDTHLVFIIGLDAFLDLPSWKEPERLLESCDFAVVSRAGFQFKSLETLLILGVLDTAKRSEEHTSELQSLAYLVCRLL